MKVAMRNCVGFESSAKTLAPGSPCAPACARRQAAEHHHVARCDQFGAGVDVADDHDVADVVQRLTAAQRADVVERLGGRSRRLRGARGFRRRRPLPADPANADSPRLRRSAMSVRAPAKSATSERAESESLTSRGGRSARRRASSASGRAGVPWTTEERAMPAASRTPRNRSTSASLGGCAPKLAVAEVPR